MEEEGKRREERRLAGIMRAVQELRNFATGSSLKRVSQDRASVALRAAATFLHNPRIRSNGEGGGRDISRRDGEGSSAFITTHVSSRPVARGEPRVRASAQDFSRPPLAFFTTAFTIILDVKRQTFAVEIASVLEKWQRFEAEEAPIFLFSII